jgi:hypothetical protein
MAVWVGNHDVELPLRDRDGARITGTSSPVGSTAPSWVPLTTGSACRWSLSEADIHGQAGAGDVR